MRGFKVGIALVILLAVAVANDWSLPDRLIVMLAVVLLVAWIWNSLSLRRIGMRRQLSIDRVRAGDWITETLTLTNHALLPKLWIEVRDLSSLPGYQAGQVVHVPGRGAASWEAHGLCARRGRYRLGPVTLVAGDPLGLFRSVRNLAAVHELIVYPAPVDVSSIPLPRTDMTGSSIARGRGFHAAQTAASIRDYEPGDPFNRIAWSATARLGRMMVKEFDPDPSSDVWVVLDLSDGSSPRESSLNHHTGEIMDQAVEHAIAVAGSLVERILGEGRRAGLIVNRSMPLRLDPDSSHRQWFRVFELLAVVTSFGSRSLNEALSADSRRFTRNSSIVVITTHPEDSWVPVAQSLVQRQVPITTVIVGSLRELQRPEMQQLKAHLLNARIQVAESTPSSGVVSDESAAHLVA